ncbi:MAG: CsgG/HfaB family protein [Smithella sp.]|nr:CsgG/HfaB family protein [Smithella sp.]
MRINSPQFIWVSTSTSCRILFGVTLVLILLLNIPFVHAESVVLIPPFENLSKYKAISSYRTNTGTHSEPSRSYTIDRYSEIPRNIIEDIIINKGGKVVERQRIDSIVLEGDFVTMSGLVESSKALKLGKMLGANTIIQGSIVEIRTKETAFSGYGIHRKTRHLIASLRLRAIDIESGRVVYSKTMDGQVVTTRDNFSSTEYCDEVYDAIKAALEPLSDDSNFLKIIK